MAKTYTWNSSYGRIDLAGGTSVDPITFKDITDYYEANPLLNDWNIPRLYGGVPYILGDSPTFTGVAGDTIKVVYEGTTYDDIAIGTATSIANVVTAINNALPGSPASVDATTGYLKIQCLNNYDGMQTIGDVSIDDGSGTGAPCVARLFSVAGMRDSSVFDFPYELTEGNASNWFGASGLGTPANDSSSGDFTKGYASVTSAVSSVPTGTSITRVDASVNSYILVYMTDTSAFSLYDEVVIQGTTNFNGEVFRIAYISANTYVRGYLPRNCTSINETGISGATLLKPLQLCWNLNYAVTYKGISLANKIKISAKSDGAGTPKIIGVVVRNSYGSGTLSQDSYGAMYKADWTLTSSWQDFEIDIRTEMNNYYWQNNTSARGYWGSFCRIYIMFDGLSVGENVWIDGVRFTCTNRNPTRTTESNYVFPVGLNIPSGCWFKDYGFNVRFDTLESNLMTSGYRVLTAIAANLGEIDFGDYGGTEKEGGVFIFNAFCMEDTGGLAFTKVRCQGITFTGFKNQYGGFTFAENTGNYYRNCNWINMLNFFGAEANSSFENCSFMGGRYFMAFPLAGTTINGFTCYGVSGYPFYIRATLNTTNVKGVKIIDATTSKTIVNMDSYNATVANKEGIRLINLDISECATTSRMYIGNNTAHYPYTVQSYVAFSFNLTVTDTAGNAISGATVSLKDKDSNVLFTTTTNAIGVITEQTVDTMKAYLASVPAGNSKYFYFDTPTVDWTYYYPFTLTVSKSGYETYTDVLLKDGYSRTNEICKKGFSGKVGLKSVKAVRIDTQGHLYVNLDKENTGKKISLLKI